MRRWMLAATVVVLATGCRYETVPGGILHLDDDEFSTAWRLDRWTGEMCWFVADDVSDPVEEPPTLQGCVPGEQKRAAIHEAELSALHRGRRAPAVGG